VALDFDKLKPEAKKAAFAHMDRARGVGSFRKKGSGSIAGRLFDKPTAKRGKSSLGSGARHKKLTAGQKSGIKATPKSAPKATPDTPEGRFNKDFTDFMKKFTSDRPSSYVGMVDVRKELDARGMPRAEQDAHLKRMGREGKLHIIQEDNRKAMRQEDHDAALNLGGEPNDLVQLTTTADADDFAKMRKNAAKAPTPKRTTDPNKLAAERTPEDHADLAQKYLEMHGSDGVAFQIKTLERRQAAGKLGPGQRAQLAALKSLGNK
jgi:hypothetical protein